MENNIVKAVAAEDKERFLGLLGQDHIPVSDRMVLFQVHHVIENRVVYSSHNYDVTRLCELSECYIISHDELNKYNDLLVKGYMVEGGEKLFRALIKDKLDKFESPFDVANYEFE